MASATMDVDMVANETENDGAEAKVAGAEHTQQECNGDRPEVQCSVCGRLGHAAGDECCPLRDIHRSPDGYGGQDEDTSTTTYDWQRSIYIKDYYYDQRQRSTPQRTCAWEKEEEIFGHGHTHA